MGLKGDLTAEINLDQLANGNMRFDELLFSESHGRFILTTKESDVNEIKKIFEDKKIPCRVIGKVTDTNSFKFAFNTELVECSKKKLRELFFETIPRHMGVDKWKS